LKLQSTGLHAGGVVLGAALAVGLAQPAAFAGQGGASQVTAVNVTRTADGVHELEWTVRKSGTVYVYASTDSRDPSRSGRLVAATKSSGTRVEGLDAGKRWYFEAAPRRSANAEGPVAGTRRVALEGSANTRDLGGHRTSDGRTVRWGLVYRSDSLGKATEADVARLASLGLSTSVDFRGEAEVVKYGVNRLPAGVEAVARPLLDESGNTLAEALTTALRTGDSAVLEEMLGGGRAEQIVLTSYRDMVTNEAARAGFRDVLLRLAGRDGLPLVYNCTAGKDRTGIMSAVILTLLRVPRQAVIDDFVLSNTYLSPSHQQTYDLLASKGVDSGLIRPLLEQDASYIEAFLDGAKAEYGSFDRYLRDGLGLSQKTITHLRHALTTR